MSQSQDDRAYREDSVRRRVGLVITAVLVFGFPGAGIGEEMAVVEEIRRCLELLHGPEFELARGCFAPEMLSGDNEDLLTRTHEALQLGDPIEYDLLDQRFSASTETTSAVGRIFHVHGDHAALILVVLSQEIDSRPVILNITWDEAPLDLADRYPLTLRGMSAPYYLMALYAVLLPCFMIYTAVVCIRRQPKFLWGWVAFVLLGVGNLSILWRPGPLDSNLVVFAPISIQILGVGLSRFQESNPWLLTISFPLGAASFLWWTRKWASEDVDAGTVRPEG
jgi:hypothetical protein